MRPVFRTKRLRIIVIDKIRAIKHETDFADAKSMTVLCKTILGSRKPYDFTQKILTDDKIGTLFAKPFLHMENFSQKKDKTNLF